MASFEEFRDDEKFGHYRPVRKLGQGGTSIVFEGRRDSEDFSRRVAIKVVLGNIPATLPEGETRVLAQLEHPNIARLLDAGSTGSGLRYLVMEYVDGLPCTEYADQQKLDEPARLRVFLQICEAVRYANRSLVIHCDIKPANVLVCPDGTVKLLDFGIARVLSDLTEPKSQTRIRYYSPDYASPEQIEGRPLTVATDVYSLGVLLRVLAGARGDLRLIADKACQKDPALRYGTVAELADDVGRYLAGRPVVARPPSSVYRLRKFLWRNRLAATPIALVVVALILTTVFALKQRRLAAQRFDDVRKLANSLLFEIHDEIAKLPASLRARHILANQGAEYLNALARSAGSDDSIQLEAAKGYLRLADIEGVGNEPSLGQSSQALPRLLEADRMVQAVISRSPSSVEAQRARYLTLEALATLYSLQADPRAVATSEELLGVAEANAKRASRDSKVQEELAHALFVVANGYTQSKTHNKQGVEAWGKAVAAWKKLCAEDPGSIVRKRELARSYQYQAGALSRDRRREEARETILIAYQMHKELALIPGEDVQRMLATDVGLLANLLAQLKRYSEAIPLFEEQLRLREIVASKDPGNNNALMGVAGTLGRIGFAYVLMDKTLEGLPYLERSLAKQREVYAKDPENTFVNREMLYVLSDLTDASETLKRRDKMCRYAAEAAQILKGPISKTRETATDASKKAYVKKIMASCGAASQL